MHKQHNRLFLIAYKHLSETQNTWRVSLDEAWKQPISLNGRHNLTELNVFCTIAGQSGKPTRQTRALNPNRRKQLRKVETVILKWLITIGRLPSNEVHENRDWLTAFGRMYVVLNVESIEHDRHGRTHTECSPRQSSTSVPPVRLATRLRSSRAHVRSSECLAVWRRAIVEEECTCCALVT